MPLQKLQFRPGLNREGTDYSNEGGWFDGDKIRFRSGFPEKIGGWSQVTPQQFLGTCRSLWNWATLNTDIFIGVGTNLKYYINYSGGYYDITPIYFKSTIATFTTSNGLTTVTVTDTSYNPNVGDYITIPTPFTYNGITFTGQYVVQTVDTLTDTYTITATAASGSGTSTAHDVHYQYPVGLDTVLISNGWGASPWGLGGWGLAYAGGIAGQLRLWSADNYGQDLVLAPRNNAALGAATSAAYGGGIYYWQASGTYTNGVSAGLNTRAQSLQALSTAAGYSGNFVPNNTYQIVASAIQRFVIAFGSNSYDPGNANTDFDPMLVRWSDQENPYEWVPAVTNQSGEFRLTNGSYIMGARSTRQEILVWTDSAIYSMQYLGPPYVWGFQILMDNISIISPNAMITVKNVTYWMGMDTFYIYSGRVETLPCSLRQYIFTDLNKDQGYQVFCGSNEGYNEVWWFYCSKNSNVIDKYVIYNYLDRVWYYGTMGRTAWLETGILQYPVAADYNNRLLFHESAVDDVSGSEAVPINAYIQSSDFDIGDGHNFGFVWRILPDVNFNGSNVNQPQVTMTVKPRQNSGTAYGLADNPRVISANNFTNVGTYNVQQFTGQVYTRLRGRQMAFRIESDTLGVAWQLGSPRIDIRNDGRR